MNLTFIWFQFWKSRILAADISDMLYVHPFKFSIIFLLFLCNVFNNINEYANKIMCIPYYWIKVLSLNFYLVTRLNVWNS